MNAVDLTSQAADLHERLKSKLRHNWRLETWQKKYEARLREYGPEKCRIAVDGFCSMKWWVENKSQDAPDCIFRSDKSFERFLAAGMKLPEHAEANRERDRKKNEQASRMAEIRKKLGWDNSILTARMQKKLAPLSEKINARSWKAFIEPLLFVKSDHGTMVLFSEDALWIQDHYADLISQTLGAPVRVVNDLP